MIFLFEMKKLYKQKTVFWYALILLSVNLFLLWANNSVLEQGKILSSEKILTAQISTMSEDDKADFVAMQLEKYNAFFQIEEVLQMERYNMEEAAYLRESYKHAFEKYSEEYSNGFELEYTDVLWQEVAFLTSINNEIKTVQAYNDFLSEIDEKAKTLQSLSIFGGEGTYDYNNIVATQKAYSQMQNIQIIYSPQAGFLQATNFFATDILLGFFMVLVSFLLVKTEQDTGIIKLVRSTPQGKGKTAISKWLALAVFLFFMVLLMYASNFLFAQTVFGLGDLTRPIQSLPILMRSVLQINLWQYISLFLIAKWVGLFICGSLILLIVFMCKSMVKSWFFSVLSVLLFFIIYIAIPATSTHNFLKYANLISLLQTNEIIGSYRNIYGLNNSAISLVLVSLLFALLFGGVCIGLFYLSFQKMPILQSKKLVVNIKKHKIKAHSIFYFEFKKLSIYSGAMPAFLVFLSIIALLCFTNDYHLTPEEFFYKQYMLEITGETGKERQEILNEQKEEFEHIYSAKTEEEKQELLHMDVTLNLKYNAYQRVLSDIEALRYTGGEHLTYKTGYLHLFEIHGHHQDTIEIVLLSILGIVFSISGFCAMEHKSGMIKILQSTPQGKNKTIHTKILLTLTFSILIALISYVPAFVRTLILYGFEGVMLPLSATSYYGGIIGYFPIIFMIFIQLIMRILAISMVSAVTLCVSHLVKNQVSCMMLIGIALFFPLVIAYFNVPELLYFSIFPLFNIANLLSQNIYMIITALIYTVFAMLVIYFSINILRRDYTCREEMKL